MSQRFSDLGVAFERITAVDGRHLRTEEIDALRIQTPGWIPLSAGEVGCFLSHRQCWQRIAQGEEPYGCVFEDDVLLSSRLPEFLSDTIWIPKDTDIVKIEDAGIRVWLDRAFIERADGFRLGRLRSANYCAGGSFSRVIRPSVCCP
jgi:glycosyl transferase family 25